MIKKEYEKLGWRKYNPSEMVYKYAECFYQKIFHNVFNNINDDRISIEIVEYDFKDTQTDRKKSWELHIYIPEEISIIGETIKVNSYSYDKLNFREMERDARKIMKGLIKEIL